jgi:hypothetical protein
MKKESDFGDTSFATALYLLWPFAKLVSPKPLFLLLRWEVGPDVGTLT